LFLSSSFFPLVRDPPASSGLLWIAINLPTSLTQFIIVSELWFFVGFFGGVRVFLGGASFGFVWLVFSLHAAIFHNREVVP
jgi:hypothetical protein